MAGISNIELISPEECNKDQRITGQDLQVNFFVQVDAPGCYAVAVRVLDKSFSGEFSPLFGGLGKDKSIASNVRNGALECLCFEQGETKKLSVISEGGVAQLAPGFMQLKNPLRGVWPPDDGFGDDTLELYASIELYLCSEGPCSGHGKRDCRFLIAGKLRERTAIATASTRQTEQKCEIADGEGGKKLADAAMQGAGLLLKSRADAPGDQQFAVLLSLRAELDDRILGVQRRIAALEQSSGPRE